MRGLLWVVVLLAGCTAAPAVTPSAGLRGASFHTGFGAGEPTIGVGKDGALFVTGFRGPATIDDVPAILRSRDGGRTWEDVGPTLPAGQKDPPYTGDPFLTLDVATGRVFSADLTSYSCMSLAWSDDEGATWTANPAACSLTAGFIDHPSLVAAKPRLLPTVGYADVLHVCFNSLTDARCARSLDGGLTFGHTRPVVFTPAAKNATDPTTAEECGHALTGHLKASPDGTVWLPVVDECTGVPMVAVSRDDGLTWTTRVISKDRLGAVGTDSVHEANVAIDADGRAFATWMSGGLPYVASSSDLGATWTPARRVSPPDVTAAEFPAIAAGGGRLVVAYLGTTIPGGYEGRPIEPSGALFQSHHPRDPNDWKNATWNAYLGVLQPDGSVKTATANDPSDPLARGACGRMRCATQGDAIGMGDFIGLVVDASGRPWASFVDACTRRCATDPSAGDDVNEGLVATLME